MTMNRRTALHAGTALLILGCTSSPAYALELEIPVACTIGTDCFVQNYVDHDPGPGRHDFTCGQLTYDGEKGTDFRTPSYVSMRRGVRVLAAAPGVVRAVRDGMPDTNVNIAGRGNLQGKDAGNGVLIDHGDGWETQYSHLQRNSVSVRPGQRVEAGQALGLIGLSGNTEFPHLDFSVRHNGSVVDPYVGLVPSFACNGARKPLWSAAALPQLAYRASGALSAGFAAERPVAERARDGAYDNQALPNDAGAIVFWVDTFGVRAGDRQSIRITDGSGRLVHEATTTLPTDYVVWFAFAGTRRPANGWQSGTYKGVYSLSRGGTPVIEISRTISLAPPS